MSVTVAPSQSDIAIALRALLVAILPSSVAVVKGQDNRVAEPQGSDYVVLTPILRNRLSTNVEAAIDAATPGYTSKQSTMLTMQMDIHGPNSSDNGQMISTLLRSPVGGQILPQPSVGGVSLLYAGDPKQMPFVNAEGQYETRWTIDAVLQVDQVVTTQIPAIGPQFANTVTVAPRRA